MTLQRFPDIRIRLKPVLVLLAIVLIVAGCSTSSLPGRGESASPTSEGAAATPTRVAPMSIVTPTPVTPVVGGTGTGAVQPPGENPATYVVIDGDNLYSIALKFDVELNALIEANGLTDPNDIQVGQELKIPPKQ